MRTPELSGKRFGRLVVIKKDEEKSGKSVWWKCKCDCGTEKSVTTSHLIRGEIRSCGCLHKGVNATHHESHTRLYNIWQSMKQRCCCPTMKRYKDYGGRGISVCSEWDNYLAFRDWSYKNGYNDTLTIDRINVNGNYEPSNCRWVDMQTQQRNRRNNIRVTYHGETKLLFDWCEVLGLDYRIAVDRICHKKWTVERAFEQPVRRISIKL